MAFNTVRTVPQLKELYEYITPKYAAHWKVIGTLLDISTGELNAIEAGWPTNAKYCCNKMLDLWVAMDTKASWERLNVVIDSPAVCSGSDNVTSKLDKLTVRCIDDPVATLCNSVAHFNIQGRLNIGENTWPQWYPKGYIPLQLIYYYRDYNLKQMLEKAELKHDGNNVNVTNESSDNKLGNDDTFHGSRLVANEISEILAPLEKNTDPSLILIEGTPGIGKSVLLKEIAYQWGKKKLLKRFELVILLCLRDPNLQQIHTVDGLLQLFIPGYSDTKEIAKACEKYLRDNNGRSLTLLLDGYDEYPEELRNNGLIALILNREILSHCGLVVSSRPHASQQLREKATVVVDIMGFTETERQHFIEQELQGKPQKIEELKQYLDKQSTIDSLCFVPFTMVILLHLFKVAKRLPKNASELYNHFICFTISRYLSKSGSLHTFTSSSLADLPEPYNRVIKQLSELSLQSLNSRQLIFTLDEILAACPNIATIPGAIHGFGLLHVEQHVGVYSINITLNFEHSNIQEFLAAYCLTLLPPDKEFQVIKEKFWSTNYFNMFSIWTSLTKGQRSSFKDFLSGGNKAVYNYISEEFLKDLLKCLRLYSCFKEAGDQKYCHAIEQAEVFDDKGIYLKYIQLSAIDLQCISLFLTSSSYKDWENVNLSFCYFQDSGLYVLYRGLLYCKDVTIKELSLMDNNLTDKSAPLISDITLKFKVNKLLIDGNKTIGENQQLYSMLMMPETTLQRLDMRNTKLTSQAAIKLFNALQINEKLEFLDISANAITDEVCDAMKTLLQMNHRLQTLNMYSNQISIRTSQMVVKALQKNKTLKLLVLPDCALDEQVIIKHSEDDVNKKREREGCQVKLQVQFALIT